MAQGSNTIETRIALQGGDEVKRQLQQIGQTGEKAFSDIGKSAAQVGKFTAADEIRKNFTQIGQAAETSGNQVRASLIAATTGLTGFTSGTTGAAGASGNMRFALQNLSFQVNDVATSLASGGSAMRVFAQQSGQIVQVFQQGGGIVPVLRAAGSAIAGLITPLRLAAGGAVAVGAAIAVVLSRTADSQASARQFDIALQALGKSSQATGKELEAAAQRLRDVGLSADDARERMRALLASGVRPGDLERVVRIGQDIQGAFGENASKDFLAAAGQGGEALQQFAEKFGLIPKGAAEAEKALSNFAAETAKANQAISQSIFDEQRNAARQIADLTREKGTAQFEIERASQQRIADLLSQRNRENAQRLAEFNKQIEESAQKAAGGTSLLGQIEQRVGGSFARSLNPLRKAFLDLSVQWNEFLNAMANSKVVQATLEGLRFAVVGLVDGLAALTKNVKDGGWGTYAVAAAVALPIVVGLGVAFTTLAGVITPVATGLVTIAATVGWPAVLLAGVVALVAAFADWDKVWAGSIGTAQAFLQLLQALGTYIAGQFVQLVSGALKLVQDAWTSVTTWIGARINDLLGFFSRLVDGAKAVASAIGGIFGGGAAGEGGATPAPAFAAGGRVSGRGTGTSDSILSWLSNGEFVINAAATRAFLPLLEAINGGMGRSLLPQQRRGFAAGGLVAAGGAGGTPVTIVLDGQSFGLRGTADVVGDLAKAAQRARMLSAGRL